MSNKTKEELLDLLTDKQKAAKLKAQERAKENYLKNKEKIQSRIKNHYLANKTECIARVKKYNKEHAEEIRDYAKKYYAKKKEKKAAEKAAVEEAKVEEKEETVEKVDKKSPLHCEECDCTVSFANRYAHFLSNKHLKNKKKNQDKIDELMTDLGKKK